MPANLTDCSFYAIDLSGAKFGKAGLNGVTFRDATLKNVSFILRKGWNPAVKIDAAMDELFLRIMDQNFVPAVDDRGKFIGIITRKDVIKYYCENMN